MIGVPGAYNHICKFIQVSEDVTSSDRVNHLGEIDGRCDRSFKVVYTACTLPCFKPDFLTFVGTLHIQSGIQQHFEARTTSLQHPS